MNCVIYLRVSTKEQAEKDLSIPAQKEACLKYIQDKGWNFIDMYVDRGESARSARRPQLQEMLSRIKKDKTINAVVVHKIDRLARNLEDHVAIKAILKRQNVQLVSVVENIEDSASGHLIEGIHALMAEFYSANLATEIKKGMGQKAKKGGWPTLAPVGYKNIRDERGIAHIVPDPEMAPLVEESFKLYATGEYSIKRLHTDMIDKGLISNFSKKPIVLSKFGEMLKNKAYIGIVKWNGVEYSGKHEPIISKALFSRVQEIFSMHDKAGERVRTHPHYLRGTLYCGECGSRLSSSYAKGKYLYFYCLGKRRDKRSCKQSHIPIGFIDKAILELYKDIQLPQNALDDVTNDLEKELMDRETFNFKQKEIAAKKIARLTREREKLMTAYFLDAIPVEILKKEQDRITNESSKLEATLDDATVHMDQIKKVILGSITMASRCYLAYQKALPKNRRLLNQTFFEKIYLKDKKISGYKYTDFFAWLHSLKSSDKNPLVEVAGVEPASE